MVNGLNTWEDMKFCIYNWISWLQHHVSENNDEQSMRMAQLWDSIENDICQPALVGIRIFQGTETAKQFAQIC